MTAYLRDLTNPAPKPTNLPPSASSKIYLCFCSLFMCSCVILLICNLADYTLFSLFVVIPQ